MMDRLRKRMGEEQRQAIADKFGDEFRRGMGGSDRNPSADVSPALEPLRRAGQSAIDAGELRQGDAARAMGDHAEPDADDMGGPSDYDADNAAPPPRRSATRMRAMRTGMNADLETRRNAERLREAARRGR